MPQSSPQPPEKSSKSIINWGRRTFYVLCILIILALALPVGLRLAAEYWLNEQPEIIAQIGDIDLNLFTGKVQISDLIIQHQGQDALALKTLGLEINWWPLWKKRISIKNLTLDDGLLRIEQLENQPIIIGGFVLTADSQVEPPLPTESTESAPNAKEWGINTGDIFIKDFQIDCLLAQQKLNLSIHSITTTAMKSWHPELSGKFGGDFSINGAKVVLKGQLQPFSAHASATSSLTISRFPLSSISPLLTNYGLTNVAGNLSTQLQLNLLAPQLKEQTATSHIEIQGKITGENLRGSNAQLWLRNLGIVWDGSTTIDITTAEDPTLGQVDLKLDGTTTLTDTDLELQQSGLRLRQHQLAWQGNVDYSQANINPPRISPVQLQGNLSAVNTVIEELEQQRQLATLQKLDIKDLQLLSDAQLACTDITLVDLTALHRYPTAPASSPASAPTNTPIAGQSGKQAPDIIHLAQAKLNNVALIDFNQLSAQKLHLQGLQLNMQRTATGALELQQWLPAPGNDERVAQETKPAPAQISSEGAPTQTEFSFQLEQIQIDGNSNLYFSDYHVQPAVTLQLNNLALTLDNIASAKPQQNSNLTLTGQLDKYSNLSISGQVQPFASQTQFNLTGKIQEFNLPTLAPYVATAAGYRLNQGQLNVDFTAPCTQGQLNLETKIYLQQLRLQPLSPEDDANAAAAIGMPVNMALALLRERNGDIHLQLPVNGNLENPNFKLGPIVRLALGNAVKNTVMLTLAPLGIVTQAGQLLGIGNSLTFERLQFIPGTTSITPETELYLPKIATLLTKRPQIVLTLHSFIAQEDLEQLKLDSSATKQPQNTPVTIPKEQLVELAQQRSEIIKDALLAQKVTSAQLLLAQPQSVISDAAPGVDLILQ